MSAYSHYPEPQAGTLRPVDAFKAALDLIKTNYFLLLGVTLVGVLIGAFTCTILIGPMLCGVFMCYLAAMRGEPVAFDRLFKGFDYFLPSFLVGLVMVGLAVVINIPNWIFGAMSPANTGDPNIDIGTALAASGVGLVINIVTALVQSFISTMLMFAFPLIVDRGLGAGDALGTSLRACLANIPGVIGLVGINFGLGIVGVLLCCIGGIFLMPVQFAMYAFAYRQMFPELGGPSPAAYPPAQGGWPPQSPGGGWPPAGQGPYGGPGGPAPY